MTDSERNRFSRRVLVNKSKIYKKACVKCGAARQLAVSELPPKAAIPNL